MIYVICEFTSKLLRHTKAPTRGAPTCLTPAEKYTQMNVYAQVHVCVSLSPYVYIFYVYVRTYLCIYTLSAYTYTNIYIYASIYTAHLIDHGYDYRH